MRITLINPPKLFSVTNWATGPTIPPLGLAYIAASLNKTGHAVSVIDAVGEAIYEVEFYRHIGRGDYYLQGLSAKEVCGRIPGDTELIGFSCMFSPQWPVTADLISQVRGRFPSVPIVIGGEHGSALPRYSLESSKANIVVMGEGEETIAELVFALEREGPKALSTVTQPRFWCTMP